MSDPGPPPKPASPFDALDGQRTFVLPTPGRRGADPMRAARPDAVPEAADDIDAPDVGLNPLVALANPVLAIGPQLRATVHVADVGALRGSLAQAIRDFESRTRAAGFGNDRVIASRYVVCTFLDECATSTPWGGSGTWGRESLLTIFHNENVGGEKVFQLLSRLVEKPAENRDLLELIYAVLALGFEGRYHLIAGGRGQLDAVRQKLAATIRGERGDYARPLASHWQVKALPGARFAGWTSVWAGAALLVALLGATFLGLLLYLNSRSDEAYRQIQALRLPAPNVVLATPAPAPTPRLAQFLSDEIRAQLVTVNDERTRSVVTLRGDGLFESGSTTVSASRLDLIRRIAVALTKVEGEVLVTGHTDNQPIRSVRFPSNFHLSTERAETVRGLLVAQGVAEARIRAEGRADGEPVAANDTPANRAQNRRVEIVLDTTRVGVASR